MAVDTILKTSSDDTSLTGVTKPYAVRGQCQVAAATWTLQSDGRVQLFNLTGRIREFVQAAGVQMGILTVASLHTTCAVMINEWQDALLHDIKAQCERMACRDGAYRHNDPAWSDCDRRNADAHLRTMILGTRVSLDIEDSQIVLGQWQSIIMAEFDGPRERQIRVQVMGLGAYESRFQERCDE
jgi:secondary thiamine-phosphate synthase enzyme